MPILVYLSNLSMGGGGSAAHPVSKLTQLHPQRATGGRYGSFAGKPSASAGHPVGKLTQLRPQRATGGRYHSFAGRPAAGGGGTHPVGKLTQLRPQRATGGRYGSFAGRTPGPVTYPAPTDVLAGLVYGPGGIFTGTLASSPNAPSVGLRSFTTNFLAGPGTLFEDAPFSEYPDPAYVLAGVVYGPGGVYIGALTPSTGETIIGLRSFTGRS